MRNVTVTQIHQYCSFLSESRNSKPLTKWPSKNIEGILCGPIFVWENFLAVLQKIFSSTIRRNNTKRQVTYGQQNEYATKTKTWVKSLESSKKGTNYSYNFVHSKNPQIYWYRSIDFWLQAYKAGLVLPARSSLTNLKNRKKDSCFWHKGPLNIWINDFRQHSENSLKRILKNFQNFHKILLETFLVDISDDQIIGQFDSTISFAIRKMVCQRSKINPHTTFFQYSEKNFGGNKKRIT